MNKLYYLAYGSNLHPLRLKKRVPSARFLGLISMSGYLLHFHKRHEEDNSGKCNMFQTGQTADVVYAALFEIAEHEKPHLDQCEGPGYRCDKMKIQLTDNRYDCFVYIAEESHIDEQMLPHGWYKQIVLLGAEYYQFPVHYLNHIR